MSEAIVGFGVKVYDSEDGSYAIYDGHSFNAMESCISEIIGEYDNNLMVFSTDLSGSGEIFILLDRTIETAEWAATIFEYDKISKTEKQLFKDLFRREGWEYRKPEWWLIHSYGE